MMMMVVVVVVVVVVLYVVRPNSSAAATEKWSLIYSFSFLLCASISSEESGFERPFQALFFLPFAVCVR